jgi:RimJ/RimL family protein N-acetyltransferase
MNIEPTQASQEAPFLSGKRVYLRPLEREDLPALLRWINDPETRMLTGETMPMSRAGGEAYFERIQKDSSRVWLVVVERETGNIIGEAGLLRIFHPWRTADLTMILGDPAARGKGYGREAILLLMEYAFGALALHRLAIGVVGFNERALRFYESVGFQREGVQRDGYFYNHQFSDFVMMSILEDAYRARFHPAA